MDKTSGARTARHLKNDTLSTPTLPDTSAQAFEVEAAFTTGRTPWVQPRLFVQAGIFADFALTTQTEIEFAAETTLVDQTSLMDEVDPADILPGLFARFGKLRSC